MGEIRTGICPHCGYRKELYVGVGMAGIRVSAIERLFPAEIVDNFKREQEAGRVKDFLLEQAPAVCSECEELLSVPFFHYELENGEKKKYIMACEKCAKPVKVLTDKEVVCPKCNHKMDFVMGGRWD